MSVSLARSVYFRSVQKLGGPSQRRLRLAVQPFHPITDRTVSTVARRRGSAHERSASAIGYRSWLHVDFPHGSGPARLGRGVRRDARVAGCPPLRWRGSLVVCVLAGHRVGSGSRGSVRLVVALPSSLSVRLATGRQ